ncbi:hypothetical protein A2335_04970 [Candidatus Peregrinibacteria bacterium RIFOXYB2_FULL_32_7]|nr:MAG: hypothetical protein A2335_04970 [Candidatus Peregrinibacteria bacterium RIFOXYB2_FULL_32_7]
MKNAPSTIVKMLIPVLAAGGINCAHGPENAIPAPGYDKNYIMELTPEVRAAIHYVFHAIGECDGGILASDDWISFTSAEMASTCANQVEQGFNERVRATNPQCKMKPLHVVSQGDNTLHIEYKISLPNRANCSKLYPVMEMQRKRQNRTATSVRFKYVP